MPVLGICGGQQLLAVALGGTLIQHIPDERARTRWRTSSPTRATSPAMACAVVPGTLLHRIVGATAHAGQLGAPPGGAGARAARRGERAWRPTA